MVVDVEDKEMLKLSTHQRTDACMAFCNEIEKNGYYAMVYTNKNWLENYLHEDEILSKYDLWLAQWGVATKSSARMGTPCEQSERGDEPAYNCGIWQYSETGKIDGINGNVDLNFAYKDYPYVMRRDGLNGFKKRSSSNPKLQYFEYKVQKGDVLWNLAKKYLGDGNRYKEIKSLNNLSGDTIYAGKTIKIPK